MAMFSPEVMAAVVRLRRGGYVLARVVRGVVALIVAVLVLYVVLKVLQANFATNTFAQVVEYLAGVLDLGMSNLFMQFGDPVDLALNHGLAVVLWLVIGSVLGRLVERV